MSTLKPLVPKLDANNVKLDEAYEGQEREGSIKKTIEKEEKESEEYKIYVDEKELRGKYARI